MPVYVPAPSPGGSSGQVQYNSLDSFGGVTGSVVSGGVLRRLTIGDDTDNPSPLNEIRIYDNYAASAGWYWYFRSDYAGTGGGLKIGGTGNRSVTVEGASNGDAILQSSGGSAIVRGVGTTVTVYGAAADGQVRVSGNASYTSTPVMAVRGPASQTAALVQLQGRSSTTDGRPQAEVDTAWVDSTDATRKARAIRRAYDTAARETDRGWADGSAGRFACAAPASAPTDAHLAASQISFYLDEGGNKLHVRVKYADGTTLKTGEIALT